MPATIIAAALLMAQAQPGRSVQQDFDAAAAMTAPEQREAALAAWEALERRAGSNPRTRAVVLVRKSAVLLRLGRVDDALAAARMGLANLPKSDPSLRPDRYNAQFDVGRIEHSTLDFANAAKDFRAAADIAPTPEDKLAALLGLVQTETFVDSDAALRDLAALEALAAAPATAKATQAQVALARATLLLNRGDPAGARTAAASAVTLNGGMTSQTSLADVSARSTAALASLLAGSKDDARRYMAMTGAGRLSSKGTFNPAAQIVVPDCGGEAGLKPQDMAVIEFWIGDDGQVFDSQPVYAAGGGAVALEFARTARAWSWTADQVKEMPPFFRYAARVELRCNLAFDRPSPAAPLKAALDAWLDAKGLPAVVATEGSAAAALPAQRARLAKADSVDATAPAVLPLLAALIDNPVTPRDEEHTLAGRAVAIATAAGAPPLVRLYFDLDARRSGSAESWRPAVARQQTAALLAEPVYAADPEARAAIRVIGADREQEGRAMALLREVADDAALPANDPYKVAALVRIASIAQTKGDTADARAAFARSGLAASQCALLDRPPTIRRFGGAFPEEAMAWGFEGWTRVQYDVGADGNVLNQRALVSYPPFIFTKAGTDTLKGSVYTKTFRPDGGLGCGATTTNVKFVLPH